MDALTALIIFAAGVGGGVIAGMVGGGSIITFPVMLAIGLPPIVATASNIVALTLSNITGVFADLKRLPRWNKSFATLAACSMLGSAVGAALLLVASEEWFALAIPLLMGLGTAVFAFSEKIKQWAALGAAVSGGEEYSGMHFVLVAATAVYGSFFGASFTVLLLAVLSLAASDLRSINVTKNLLAGIIGVVAIVIFIVQSVVATQGVVAVLPTIVLTIGAMVGGYVGGRLASVLPEKLMRWIVIGIGTFLTVHYALKYWLI